MPGVTVNGQSRLFRAGDTVAVIVLQAGIPFRRSVMGEPRTALCGMGICYECRLKIDGERHARSCQILCRDGMTIETE